MIMRDELLTKLATECATWEDVERSADFIDHSETVVFPAYITKDDWLSERERLLNKPDWPDSKRWKRRALDRSGEWHFYKAEPKLGGSLDIWWLVGGADDFLYGGKEIAVPAGCDWRESLEERPAKLQR